MYPRTRKSIGGECEPPSDLSAELLQCAPAERTTERLTQMNQEFAPLPRDTSTEIGLRHRVLKERETYPLTHSPWLAGVNAS